MVFKCTVCGADAHMVVDEFQLCEEHWMAAMKARSAREHRKALAVRHAAQARFREMFPDIEITDAVSDEAVGAGAPPSPEAEVPSQPPPKGGD